MVTKEAVIVNQHGLHARPSLACADTAMKFKSAVRMQVVKQQPEPDLPNDVVDAKSVMQVITLAAVYGDKIIVTAEGEDEEQAAQALIDLIDDGFSEVYK